MPKITQIKFNTMTKRVAVYIDYHFCLSIRDNIWQKMGLTNGSEISSIELKQKERIIWKNLRKTNALGNSKQALLRVQYWFSKHMPNLEAQIIDFNLAQSDRPSPESYPGIGSNQRIRILLKRTVTEIMTLEVASTEIRRGINYWIRAEKIDYAKNQYNRDVWIVLYCKYPNEKLIWIKPLSNKQYQREELISNTLSYFISFNFKSPEVYSSQNFCEYVQNKLDQI